MDSSIALYTWSNTCQYCTWW